MKVCLKVVLLIYLPPVAILAILNYPYDTDASAHRSIGRSASFYESAYSGANDSTRGMDYEKTAAFAAGAYHVKDKVRQFVKQYGLADKRVLDVGSGRGYLQDMVSDYTGLDLSPAVARHYHKRFVTASATAMPFADGSYDAVWSVWVLEHIPEPERALAEMRRVLKPGGVLFLTVAWQAPPWAAEGFDVRPYSDFNWRGKIVKASLAVRKDRLYRLAYNLPDRAIRWAQYEWSGAKTPLHFRKLNANYDVYWEPDSDAAVSVDRLETWLWFRARGDECLNCTGWWRSYIDMGEPLIIRKASRRDPGGAPAGG